MTEDQVKILQSVSKIDPLVHVDMILDKSDRTLLWGYTCDRYSWHVYLKHGRLYRYCYDWNNKDAFFDSHDEYAAGDLVPNKRLYPEACDFDFCRLLKKHGAWLSFTTFKHDRPPAQYHGKVK